MSSIIEKDADSSGKHFKAFGEVEVLVGEKGFPG